MIYVFRLIHVFEELLKLKSSSRQPILLFSGGKDHIHRISYEKNNIDLILLFVKNNDEKRLIETLAEKLDIKVHLANHELKHLNFDEIYFNIKELFRPCRFISFVIIRY